MSEKSITRQQAGRFRRAKNEPSAPRSLAGGCCGHKFLASRVEGALGYASLESKSEILVHRCPMSKDPCSRHCNAISLFTVTLWLITASVGTGLSQPFAIQEPGNGALGSEGLQTAPKTKLAIPAVTTQAQPAVAQGTVPAIARDPRQLVVSAKSVAIISRLGEVAQTGRLMWDPNPDKAKDKLEKAVRAWGRLTIVDDPAAADLVLVIVEGNRSSFLKQGELYEVLLAFPGGSSESEDSQPLWQQEAKEGFGGRPADKLLERFRKYVEGLDKSLPSTAIVSTGPQSETNPAKAEPASAPPPEIAVSQQPETQALTPQEGKPLPDVHVSGALETWMADSYPGDDKMPMPIAELLAAKSIAVITFGPEGAKGAKGFFGRMLTGKSSMLREASASSAKEEALKRIKSWKRYIIVEDPTSADLVLTAREWNETAPFSGRPYVGGKVALLKGGPDVLEKPQVLWAGVQRTESGKTTEVLVDEIGQALKKADKESKKK